MLKLYNSPKTRTMVVIDTARKFTANILAPSFSGVVEDNYQALQILTMLEKLKEIPAGVASTFREASLVKEPLSALRLAA